MRFGLICIQASRFGKNLVGEMVVLVDEQIDFLANLITFPVQIVKLLHCSVLPIHLLL